MSPPTPIDDPAPTTNPSPPFPLPPAAAAEAGCDFEDPAGRPLIEPTPPPPLLWPFTGADVEEEDGGTTPLAEAGVEPLSIPPQVASLWVICRRASSTSSNSGVVVRGGMEASVGRVKGSRRRGDTA